MQDSRLMVCTSRSGGGGGLYNASMSGFLSEVQKELDEMKGVGDVSIALWSASDKSDYVQILKTVLELLQQEKPTTTTTTNDINNNDGDDDDDSVAAPLLLVLDKILFTIKTLKGS